MINNFTNIVLANNQDIIIETTNLFEP